MNQYYWKDDLLLVDTVSFGICRLRRLKMTINRHLFATLSRITIDFNLWNGWIYRELDSHLVVVGENGHCLLITNH